MKTSGIGLARARERHQTIILETIVKMHAEVKQHKGWKILAEALITDNPWDNYPDIIVKDNDKYPVFVMEIIRRHTFYYDRKKCIALKARFSECEFYIYNYETDVLYYLSENSVWLTSQDYDFMHPLFQKPIMEYIHKDFDKPTMTTQEIQQHLRWMESYEKEQIKQGIHPSKLWQAAKQTIGHIKHMDLTTIEKKYGYTN